MPVATQVLEIPLPEGVETTADERERLEAVVRALVFLQLDRGRSWQAVRDRLQAEGWSVHWTIGCCAEARRGRECERGFGAGRDQAFADLLALTSMDGEPEP